MAYCCHLRLVATVDLASTAAVVAASVAYRTAAVAAVLDSLTTVHFASDDSDDFDDFDDSDDSDDSDDFDDVVHVRCHVTVAVQQWLAVHVIDRTNCSYCDGDGFAVDPNRSPSLVAVLRPVQPSNSSTLRRFSLGNCCLAHLPDQVACPCNLWQCDQLHRTMCT